VSSDELLLVRERVLLVGFVSAPLACWCNHPLEVMAFRHLPTIRTTTDFDPETFGALCCRLNCIGTATFDIPIWFTGPNLNHARESFTVRNRPFHTRLLRKAD
jgi:hypothetical protein